MILHNSKHHNNNFLQKVENNYSKTIDAILNHQYLSALEKKQISKEKLQILVYEQYHIIKNDRRNFALIISKSSDDVATELFTDCLSAEVKALDNLVPMAEELGINNIISDSNNKIELYEPLGGCHAYTYASYAITESFLKLLLLTTILFTALRKVWFSSLIMSIARCCC
jgi:thiaminase